VAMLTALVLSIVSDVHSSSDTWGVLSAYGALACHALSSTALEHTQGILIPSLGTTFTIAAGIAGASLIALPLYIFKTVAVSTHSSACDYPDSKLNSARLSGYAGFAHPVSGCYPITCIFTPFLVTKYVAVFE
jgi:hypothetical protein